MIALFFPSVTALHKQLAVILMIVLLSVLTACGGGVVGDDKNFIIVKDQTVTHLSEVVIETADVERNAIIVIYAEKEDAALQVPEKDSVLGYAAIVAGQHQNIRVQLNRKTLSNETLFAELRADNGIVGELESVSIDAVISDSGITDISFGVMHAEIHLEIVEEDLGYYVTSKSEQIDLREVIADGNSWIVVHRNEDGRLGQVMGYQYLAAGTKIILNPKSYLKNGDKVTVALYSNTNEIAEDNFDQAEDVLLTLNGKSVELSFSIILELP